MLEMKNISYEVGDKKILNNISLTIKEKFVVITGPNGSGKSTLIKTVSGFIPVSNGNIIFDGVDITNMSITDRAKSGIGYALQQPVKFKGLTCHDLISIAAGRNITTVETCEFLSDVGLCARDYVNRKLDGSLSGGELKRIEIASVIARGSALALFDEPEAGIDLWSFNSLIRVFENLQAKTKGSIVIISHQERILEIADKIIMLKGGEIDCVGTPKEIMPELTSVNSACPRRRND